MHGWVKLKFLKDQLKDIVIDTKWKNNKNNKPSTQDLRQMYVYNDYWDSYKSLLLYPAKDTEFNGFINFEERDQKCAIGKLNILKGNHLAPKIGYNIYDWFFR